MRKKCYLLKLIKKQSYINRNSNSISTGNDVQQQQQQGQSSDLGVQVDVSVQLFGLNRDFVVGRKHFLFCVWEKGIYQYDYEYVYEWISVYTWV